MHNLSTFPLTSSILKYLSLHFIESTVALVSTTLLEATRSRALWYSLLKIASKPIPPSTMDLRVYYLSNPAVPHDHKTITKAIERTKERGEGGMTTVFLEGGRIYYEDLNVQEGEKVKLVAIGDGSVAIASPKSSYLNKPLVSISPGSSLTCSNVSFVHSTPGRDIWSGNSCFSVTGGSLHLTSSTITSESGRGIVGVEGAIVHLSNSVICDCAGTGIYAGKDPKRNGGGRGDDRTKVKVEGCAVLRNGKGGIQHGGGFKL
ncbi:hypothetical protein TrCOL_g3044 [Triparma columacea]|uniref:Right handed beta helix domain-containing protein n=1 Tax=Triparma columacea TaxID=722753 RepID=A0A9W7L3Q7_9STRA|nr:hypothetical protein TrCOL_g3044 [Triparma columacea]